ncbi:MAG: hypothetical protein R3E57_08415 [Porticoccaceae bacterium]
MNARILFSVLAVFTLISAPCLADSKFDQTLELAQQGDTQAQSELGMMYAKGKGTKQNNVSAFIWMSAAKASGNQEAEHNLQALRKRMSLKEIIDGQAKAAKCIGSHYQHCKPATPPVF